jgi:hypothetical protein
MPSLSTVIGNSKFIARSKTYLFKTPKVKAQP